MIYTKLLWLHSVLTLCLGATSHWMVTENGLIQPKPNSPFQMASPNDLLAFLNQDTRWENIINLYHDLSERKAIVQRLWIELEKAADASTYTAADKNCKLAGPISLVDWYGSLLVDDKTRDIVEKDAVPADSMYNVNELPDCKKISSLTFSMFAFDHLQAMIQRDNLTSKPELYLSDHITPLMTIDQFGYWLSAKLRQNSSSWLHYNIASLYWRIRGNAGKALECSRRSVYYAPRYYKDIAMLSIGTIFHRSKMTEDAIIVLGAAADHNPTYPLNHFMLGNAFAILGNFNVSLKHYDKCLKLNPSFEIVKKHRHAVLCIKMIIEKLKSVSRYVDEIRKELAEYIEREDFWLKSQAAFLRTMKHDHDFDYRNVEKNCEKMSDLTGLDIKDLKAEGDKNALIQYFLDSPMYDEDWVRDDSLQASESATNLQRLVKHIEKHAHIASDSGTVTLKDVVKRNYTIKKEIGPPLEYIDLRMNPEVRNGLTDYIKIKYHPATDKDRDKDRNRNHGNLENDRFEFEGGILLYPSVMKVNRNSEDFDKDPDWPDQSFCIKNAHKVPKNLELVYPVFLPFENKGIRLKSLLTDMIGVPVNTEHDLPWHPPTCPQEKELSNIVKKMKSSLTSEVAPIDHLRLKLLEYVGGGNVDLAKHMQEAEIGHRIYAAMQMKLAPKWLLYTLSSLYWRVRTNKANAILCLITASKTVPNRHKDIVMTSLASVYLEMGSFSEALAAAEEAFRVSIFEPATNFVLAQLNMVKQHHSTQMFHLKQVVRVEPNFMGGAVRRILDGWACLLQPKAVQSLDDGDDEICTSMEQGLSMFCEKDGTDCHLANTYCFRTQDRFALNDGSGSILKILELKDQNMPEDRMDASFIHTMVDNMPLDRTDRIGHQSNYRRMRKDLESLRGCGRRGCKPLLEEMASMQLQEEDCKHRHLIQMGYWLHVIRLKQMVHDIDGRLPQEIKAMPPTTSKNKIPECPLFGDPSQDFYLDRVSQIDVEGWQKVPGLMHQIVDEFEVFDYATLGAKIAKFVETRSREWAGLVAAGWWCGASGHGACAVRCLLAAAALSSRREPLLSLLALLHMQSKIDDAKEIAYLMFYMSPKTKLEPFLVGVSHTNTGEYEQAVWMYRYSLSLDNNFLPARACLHATMCLMLFGDKIKRQA